MQVVKEPNIPKDWNITKITNEFKISHGKLPKEVFSEKGKDGLPYLTINSLKGQSNEFANKTDGVLVENDDIIIIGDGEGSGRCYFGKKGILSSTFLLLKNKHQKITNEFVYLYLKLNYQFFNNTKYGSGIPHIDQYLLREFQIPVPPLPEQQQIVSIISNVDDTIQKTDKIIEQTQRLKKGMMQKLLTRGIGHTKFKKTKLGEIPEEWEVVILGKICSKIIDGVHKTPHYVDFGIPFISVKELQNDTMNFENCRYISEAEHLKLIQRCNPEIDDLLLSKTGNTIGKLAVIKTSQKFSLFVNAALLKPLKNRVNSSFLSFALKMCFSERSNIIGIKSSAQPNLPLNEIKKIQILLPPLPEQQQIASILSNIDTQIGKEKLHKSNLERLKKGLMQKLLTGQIRVKVP